MVMTFCIFILKGCGCPKISLMSKEKPCRAEGLYFGSRILISVPLGIKSLPMRNKGSWEKQLLQQLLMCHFTGTALLDWAVTEVSHFHEKLVQQAINFIITAADYTSVVLMRSQALQSCTMSRINSLTRIKDCHQECSMSLTLEGYSIKTTYLMVCLCIWLH